MAWKRYDAPSSANLTMQTVCYSPEPKKQGPQRRPVSEQQTRSLSARWPVHDATVVEGRASEMQKSCDPTCRLIHMLDRHRRWLQPGEVLALETCPGMEAEEQDIAGQLTVQVPVGNTNGPNGCHW